jgi:hypothetical protein
VQDHAEAEIFLGNVIVRNAAVAPIGDTSAQEWPARTITMVVPFAAGSATDTSGRVLPAGSSEVLGQQVIVENIGGGGSMTGTAHVAKAVPDGYQFVVWVAMAAAELAPCPKFRRGKLRKAPKSYYRSNMSRFPKISIKISCVAILVVGKSLPSPEIKRTDPVRVEA